MEPGYIKAFSILAGKAEFLNQFALGFLEPLGEELFRRLAGLELAFFAIIVLLRNRLPDNARFLGELAWKLLIIVVLFGAMVSYRSWSLWFPEIFAQGAAEFVAERQGGVNPLAPGEVFAHGLKLTVLMIQIFVAKGIMTIGIGGEGLQFLGMAAGLAMLFSYLLLALLIVRLLFEMGFVLTLAPLFMAFAPFRMTVGLTDNFLQWAFKLAVKNMFVILFVGLSFSITEEWTFLALDMDPSALLVPVEALKTGLAIAAASVVYALIAWRVPEHLSENLTRNWNFGIKGLLHE
jgi:hypothetical protein